jgi:hypothetical protein
LQGHVKAIEPTGNARAGSSDPALLAADLSIDREQIGLACDFEVALSVI